MEVAYGKDDKEHKPYIINVEDQEGNNLFGVGVLTGVQELRMDGDTYCCSCCCGKGGGAAQAKKIKI
ncbi:hypothetical protein M5X00_25345 [Paenibacillus alvei]|uniref:hypothetical protein n=1 Tax=Paenibacillus alvei TaxID=44250 RepID=UPI000288337D|nr:hypothetical protein [Paenibacillus alvei]EJW14588.1 hypothetical protein PAV_12c00500 [Paenibacillus alvei DSM 29]MBG9732821.1 hypothetical protein [Paenibacillus alvei]MBG9745408.1 hypothetical protein [Paenibacillus alvei]MCY7486889.1 hypothetical protein [Paenibacillus alvei]MCY9545016.1 hypothetical protein [Paenibacillus alvei]